MTKKERLDVIVTTYQERAAWFEKFVAVHDDQLDERVVERIVQRVRRFAGKLVQAAEDLRAGGGVADAARWSAPDGGLGGSEAVKKPGAYNIGG